MSEVIIRLGAFFIVLFIMATVELIFPKRTQTLPKGQRYFINFSFPLLSNIILKTLAPFSTASVAILAHENGWGLFALDSLAFVPFLVQVIVSVVFLDFVIYAQHLIFHHYPLLWRLHKVHHIDQEIDVSTALRFHPVEIILSALIKCFFVLLLGVPFVAVVTFEVLLNAMAMFNHANIDLSKKTDAWLRRFVVTPDMHRVHHSTIDHELNSNFGFNLSLWDKLFYTYIKEPQKGHLSMKIGLEKYQEFEKYPLWKLLFLPFYKKG